MPGRVPGPLSVPAAGLPRHERNRPRTAAGTPARTARNSVAAHEPRLPPSPDEPDHPSTSRLHPLLRRPRRRGRGRAHRRLGLLLVRGPGHRGAALVGVRAGDGGAAGARRRPRSTSRPAAAKSSPPRAELPPLTVATEGWPPNVAKATALLHPRGAVVVASPEDAPLPFADAAFDLVVSRHPVTAPLDGDRPRPAPRRHVLLPARRPGSVVRTRRVLPRPAAGEVNATAATRTASAPEPRRPVSRSSTCARSGCASSSTTSGPSSTSCAR